MNSRFPNVTQQTAFSYKSLLGLLMLIISQPLVSLTHWAEGMWKNPPSALNSRVNMTQGVDWSWQELTWFKANVAAVVKSCVAVGSASLFYMTVCRRMVLFMACLLRFFWALHQSEVFFFHREEFSSASDETFTWHIHCVFAVLCNFQAVLRKHLIIAKLHPSLLSKY